MNFFFIGTDLMHNDVAILMLHTPLRFNRWVKPICLPSPERVVGVNSKLSMILGPSQGTICTAVNTIK